MAKKFTDSMGRFNKKSTSTAIKWACDSFGSVPLRAPEPWANEMRACVNAS